MDNSEAKFPNAEQDNSIMIIQKLRILMKNNNNKMLIQKLSFLVQNKTTL